MTITTMDEAFNALVNNSQKIPFFKAASLAGQVVRLPSSFWKVAGSPGIAATPTSAAACTNTTPGALAFTNPTGGDNSHILHLALAASAIQSYELHDRLAHMGGLSGTSTGSQTVGIDLHTSGLGGSNNITQRKGRSDFSAVQWFFEWYMATGSTASTATVTYTNQNGTTGRTCTVAFPASIVAGRMIPIIPSSAGDFIRSIQSIQLNGSTGTLGNFGVTATLQRTEASVGVAYTHSVLDWGGLCCPIIYDSSCLFWIGLAVGTTVTAPVGRLILGQG